MSNNNNVRVVTFEGGVRCSNDFVDINYYEGEGLAIEFEASGLEQAVFTMDSKDIESYLFGNINQPLENRGFFEGVNGDRKVRIQLVNARIFLTNAQAEKFVAVVDTFYDAYENLHQGAIA